MLNISWGTKIATLYISFVALVITMVVISMNQKIDLVSTDYYERELVFQNKINEMNNANALPQKVTHVINQEGVQLQFPQLFKDKTVTGEIVFFRPSDASKDFNVSLQLTSEGTQSISSVKFSKGMYKMQTSWTANNIAYFTEEVIVIP